MPPPDTRTYCIIKTYTMLILRNTTPSASGKTVCIVGHLHGHEVFGSTIFNHYVDRIASTPGLTIILANTAAMARNERFIDQDLNRAFPGDPRGDVEQRLAAELMDITAGYDYVLDVHTTTSPMTGVAIVPNLSDATKAIVNAFPYKEIIVMEETLTAKALIGNVANAVSIEWNDAFASTPEALSHVTTAVDQLLSGEPPHNSERTTYKVVGTIDKTVVLPEDAKNFVAIPELNITPFLLHEASYTTHQGFNVTATGTVSF